MSEQSLNVAIVGYGKMGRAIESVAREAGHRIVAIVDPVAADATARAIHADALAGADVAIEFSIPSSGAANIRALLEVGCAVVSGTTGFPAELPALRALADERGVPFLWGPNYSLGIAVLARLVEKVAPWLAAAGFDPYLFESHHAAKVDGPSGTARRLAELVVAGTPGKTEFGPAPAEGAVPPERVPVAWVRAGAVPGEHTLGWDATAETIEITHRARDRRVFAVGAVRAAQWLVGRPGAQVLEDMLNDVLGAAE